MSLFNIRQLRSAIPTGLLLLFSLHAHAVSFDATSSTTAQNTNTLTWSHTVGAGTNRKLIVGVGIEEVDNSSDETVTSVTFNGTTNLARAGVVTVASNGWLQHVEVWYLDEANIATGTNIPIVITTTGDVREMSGGAISLLDAYQGAPPVVTNSNVGPNTISTSVTTPADNSWVVDVIGSGNANSFTPGAGQTERWDIGNSTSRSAASTKFLATAGTTTITQDQNANRLAHLVITIPPVGTILPPPPPTKTCISTTLPVNGQDVNAISGSSDTNIIAVSDNTGGGGGNGQIAIFNGTTWVEQTDSDIPNEDFTDVFVFDSTNAVVVGDNGAVVLQVNGDWVDISISNQDYTTIWAYAANDIFIAGDNGRIYHWDGSNWSANLGSGSNNDDFVDSWGDATYVYFLDDDGEVFRYTRSPLALDPLAIPNPITPACSGNIDFNGFTSDGAGNFYLFGENQTPNPDSGIVFKWDGVNAWATNTCTQVFQTTSTDDINAISINPDGTFTAVGDDGVVVTSTDGTSWTEISSGGQDINAIYTLSNGNSIFGADNGSNQICTDDKPHFSISHDGAATTCTAEPITITFHDKNHNPDITYTGTINISTTTNNGNWSVINATNTITNNGSGSASYTFAPSDNGQVVLGLTSTSGEVLNINISDGTNTDFLSEDPNLTVVGTATNTFLDTFSDQTYNNSYGSLDWTTTSWIEVDGDGAGVAAGNAQIGGNELRLDDRPDTGLDTSVTRVVDLSPYSSAIFTFDFATTNGVDTSDAAVAEVSDDGGTSWTVLETFTNINGASNGSRSFTLENFVTLTATTQIRFRISNLYGGNGERFEVDNVQIEVSSPAICNVLDHIEFIHDGSALTCNPEQITVKACTDNIIPCTPYTSAVTVGLLPTGWVGGDTKTFTSATGTANYNLQHTTAEQVALNTSSITPATGNPIICRNTASGPAVPCTMDFNDSGFIFDVTTQTSCVTSSNINISAVRKSPTTEQCIPFFDGKAVPLKLWTAYSVPNSGSNQATLNYSGTDYPLNTAAPGTDVTMTFDNNGQAQFTLTYPDAGELNLNATYTGSVATSDAGLNMSGNQTYVTKPAKLYVYSDDANAACPSADPTNVDCNPAFRKTGENFNLKIRAACADNTATPNFQLNGLTLSSNLVAPSSAGSVNANISQTSFNITTNGEAVIPNQTVDQVGVFTFTTTLPVAGYLGETVIGTPALNTSANIGRFTPDHFNTLVTHGCSGGGNFTYSGQPFTVTVSARNQNDLITLNYRDGFAFGVTLSDSNALGTGSLTNNTVSSASFTSAIDGASVGAGTQTNIAYTFTNKETLPGTIKLKATDQTDAAISSNTTEGSTEIRSGRTRLENAYGSELEDLAVPAQVEFFNTNGFEINTIDTCSTVTATLTDIGTDTVTVGDGSVAGNTCIWDDDAESGANNCTNAAILPGPATSQFAEPPLAGSFNLFLLAPGANFTGDIGISLISSTWLQFDWDGDGTHDNDPNGVASFGLYRGDDRIIYWREVFQ